jgi:Ca2+-binding EF-hand superfamily protein
MGNESSRTSAEIDPQALAELRRLWAVLMHSCPVDHADEEHLPEAAFQLALTCGLNGPIVKRIFDMLDVERRGALTCDEFAVGLLPLASPRWPEADKLRFLFRCYNLDGSGGISREDLTVHLLIASMRDDPLSDLRLSVTQAEAVVDATFASVGCDGCKRLGWADFKRLLRARPRLVERSLARFRINVNLTMAYTILASDTARWLEIENCPELDSPRTPLTPRTPRTPYKPRTPRTPAAQSARAKREAEREPDTGRGPRPLRQGRTSEMIVRERLASELGYVYMTPGIAQRYGVESPDDRSWARWTIDSVADLRQSYDDARYREMESKHEQRTLKVLIPY